MGKRIIVIALVAAIIGAALWLGANRWEGRQADSEVRYVTVPASRQPLSISISGSGPLVAAERVTVRASTAGTVISLPFKSGQRVTGDELLVELDNRDLRLQARELENDLNLAVHQLRESFGLAPGQPLPADPRVILEVKSPGFGRLIAVAVAPGDEVRPGQLLARVVDDRTMVLEVLTTSTEARTLSVGDVVDVAIDGFSGYVPGTIIDIDDRGLAGEVSRWHPVQVAIGNDGVLTAGTRAMAAFSANGGFSRSGTLNWSGESSIISSVSATVARTPVRTGHSVAPGQLLVEFEPEPLLTRIRSQQLTLDRLRLRQSQILDDVAKLTLTTPLSGHVVDHHVAVGDTVRGGDPLVTVASFSALSLTIAVDELEIGGVSPGLIADISVEAVSDRVFSGHVSKIALEGTARDGVTTFDVTLETDNSDGLLRPGMTAHASLVISSRPDVLVVPVEAVVYDGPRAMVRVAVGDQIELRTITVGTVSARVLEVLSGVEEGEQVVVAEIGRSLIPSFAPAQPGAITRPRFGQ